MWLMGNMFFGKYWVSNDADGIGADKKPMIGLWEKLPNGLLPSKTDPVKPDPTDPVKPDPTDPVKPDPADPKTDPDTNKNPNDGKTGEQTDSTNKEDPLPESTSGGGGSTFVIIFIILMFAIGIGL